MITLKKGKAICPVCDVKKTNRVLAGKWQIDNFGALFCWKKRLNESGNWIFFFFKEKITLKHLKTIRLSEPRVRPKQNQQKPTHPFVDITK